MSEHIYLIISLIILGFVDKSLNNKISDFIMGLIFFIFITICDFFKLIKNLICLPVQLIQYGKTDNYYMQQITSNYDYIFFKSKNIKAATRRMKKIKKLTWDLKEKGVLKEQNKTVKILNKMKWLL